MIECIAVLPPRMGRRAYSVSPIPEGGKHRELVERRSLSPMEDFSAVDEKFPVNRKKCCLIPTGRGLLTMAASSSVGVRRMDQAPLAQLLMKHRTALYAYIFAGVRNHVDAEDVLQNVSLAIVEASAQLPEAAGFLPWALEIARRRLLKHYRQSRRERPLDPDLLAQLVGAAERVESRLPTSSYQAALQTCLDSLPPTSRELMQLRYNGSHRNVAELSDCLQQTVQSVYARLKRVKAVLRECVERRLATES
jgi:RNA polymerase sigma-70 factor (ECF subfamily)